MMSERINYLVERYFKQSLSKEEKEELALYIRRADDKTLRKLLDEAWLKYEPETRMPEQVADRILRSVLQKETIPLFPEAAANRMGKRRSMSWRMAAAAAVLVVVFAGSYRLYQHQKDPVIASARVQRKTANTIQQRGNKAVLTLSNGSRIVLDSASNGRLAQDGNSTVVKLADGSLAYKPDGSASSETLYSTMSTPRGSEYQLTLPDGSKVWLNAVSSIRFPTAFSETERRVEITGEVYFEIAALKRPVGNGRVPFIVQINAPDKKAEIEVLGTHFNVKAYANDALIRTTLMEGSVKMTGASNKCLLAPGQQAQMKQNSAIRVVKDVNIEEAIAWKNGYFQYENTDLITVLHDVARWYDLDVEFQGELPTDQFTGRIERTVTLPRLLKWMKWSDVNFTIEGKKMIVK